MAWQAPPPCCAVETTAGNIGAHEKCADLKAMQSGTGIDSSVERRREIESAHRALALAIGREKVAQWRNRGSAHAAKLAEAERVGAAERDYRKRIIALLDDALRPGCPGKFSAEQVCQIIAVACESPTHGGTAVSHWSLSSLAKEVAARGIVESIFTREARI